MTHAHTTASHDALHTLRPMPRHHVSWAAVFAGFTIAVALQMTLTVLGAAIGLTALDGQDDPKAFGIGAAIWGILVPLVTLYVGGMVAGRLAHLHDKGDAFVHGALVWALSLLLAAWMLGTGASRIIGSTLNFASNTASGALAGAGAAASRPDVDASDAQGAVNAASNAAGTPEAQQRIDEAQQRAGEVADKAQGVAAGGAWAALLAIGLSLAAAVLGARSTVHDAQVAHRAA